MALKSNVFNSTCQMMKIIISTGSFGQCGKLADERSTEFVAGGTIVSKRKDVSTYRFLHNPLLLICCMIFIV